MATSLRLDSRFPQRRLVPVGTLAACFLVASTAQRGILLSLLRGSSGPAAREAWDVMVLGTRADLALAGVAVIPLLAWATLLPHRAWSSALHRRLAGGLATLALAAWIAALAVEGALFARTGHRLGSGADVERWAREVLARDDGPLLALVAAAACVLVALVAMALLRPVLASGFSTRVSAAARLRDALLVIALSVLAIASRPDPRSLSGPTWLDQLADSTTTGPGRALARRLGLPGSSGAGGDRR